MILFRRVARSGFECVRNINRKFIVYVAGICIWIIMKIGVSVPLNTSQPIHKHWFLLLFAFLFFPATHSTAIIIKRLKMSIFRSQSRRWGEEEAALTTTKANNGKGFNSEAVAKVAPRLLKWRSWNKLTSSEKCVSISPLTDVINLLKYFIHHEVWDISDFFISTSLDSQGI